MTNSRIAELREELLNERISYGELNEIDQMADSLGITVEEGMMATDLLDAIETKLNYSTPLTAEDIVAMFPREVKLTEEILKGARIHSIYHCKGAKALQSLLPTQLHPEATWGVHEGSVKLNNTIIIIGAFDEFGRRKDMMESEIGQRVALKVLQVK